MVHGRAYERDGLCSRSETSSLTNWRDEQIHFFTTRKSWLNVTCSEQHSCLQHVFTYVPFLSYHCEANVLLTQNGSTYSLAEKVAFS